MRRLIALAQRKGGVGKTTLAISLAAELSRRGVDVAVVDSDPQRSAWAWAQPGGLRFPVHPIPFGKDAVSAWAGAVRAVRADTVIIDTPPDERAVGASVAISSLLISPCTPSGLDLDSTDQTLAIVAAVRARRAADLDVLLVPNRVDSRTLEGRQLIDELRSLGEVVSGPVGDRSAFVRAFAQGCSVAELAPGGPADLEIKALVSLLTISLWRSEVIQSH